MNKTVHRVSPWWVGVIGAALLDLALNGRLDDTIAEFQEALRLKPDFEAAKTYLRNAQEQKSKAPGR